MSARTISTDRAPKAIGPYSQGIAASGFLFLSGQIPLDPVTGDLVQGTVREEVTRVMENLKAVLEADPVLTGSSGRPCS
jgi:2-iminobutanoate/2-iminopropanoate deaminase